MCVFCVHPSKPYICFFIHITFLNVRHLIAFLITVLWAPFSFYGHWSFQNPQWFIIPRIWAQRDVLGVCALLSSFNNTPQDAGYEHTHKKLQFPSGTNKYHWLPGILLCSGNTDMKTSLLSLTCCVCFHTQKDAPSLDLEEGTTRSSCIHVVSSRILS